MRRFFFLLAVSCATLASKSTVQESLPTAGVGPFRKLVSKETQNIAPYVLERAGSQFREPAILPLGGLSVALYVTAVQNGHNVIQRTHSDDGRAFYGDGFDSPAHALPTVIAGTEPYEGADVSGPSPLAFGTDVMLYYACKGGIAAARSKDGVSFTKLGIVLASGLARAPSVAVLPAGMFSHGALRMMFEEGGRIFEAESEDGISWKRLGAVLGPGTPRTDLAPGERQAFDTLTVGDPLILPRVTSAGRLHVRVLYTGTSPDEAGTTTAIGFAARYDEDGPLSRQLIPVFSIGAHESAPALADLEGYELLYVQMPNKSGELAIAAAVSPPQLTLDTPAPYPETP